MSLKRILYVEANEDRTVGGSHRQLHDLVKFLDRTRFEPVVLFYQDNPYVEAIRALDCEVLLYEEQRAKESRVHERGRRVEQIGQLFKSIAARRSFLVEHRIDLIHINNSPLVAFDDWLPAARRTKVPIVSSAMGDIDGVEGFIKSRLFSSLDMVLPVSAYIDAGMEQCGYPEERRTMIHHGVDLDQLRARVSRDPDEVRDELGAGGDRVLGAMVGNVREWKGQHVVVEGLALLPDDVRSQLRVAFVGAVGEEDQAYADRLLERVRELDLEDTVIFTGNRNDVPDIFNAADVAIHSSVMPEPGGIVVLEALALGATVIAASRGGHTEALSDDTGRTFDTDRPEQLAERLTELVRDADLRKRLAATASKKIEDFSIVRHTERVSEVYEKLLT